MPFPSAPATRNPLPSRFVGTIFAVLVALAPALPAAAATDTGAFVVQLGRDTTSVEAYTRTQDRVVVEQVGRTPRVMQRRLTYDYAGGKIARFGMVVTLPLDTTVTQTIVTTFDPDSTRWRIRNTNAPGQVRAMVLAPDVVVVTNQSPWSGYEGLAMRLVESKRDSLDAPLWFVGAPSANRVVVRKLAKNRVALSTDRGDLYHFDVDKKGRILRVEPVAGPAQYTVTRVKKLDLMAAAAGFKARDQAGTGLGVLSPRDTVTATAGGGASITIDYSRPAKRGRTIYGGVVPYDAVWRTGANAATQIKIDKALDFGGTVVPAGFYTMWTIPAQAGWKLVFNSQTGQWGTAHDPAKDIGTIAMRMTTLASPVERFTIAIEPTATGGVMHLDWDTTRASATFTTQP